MKPEFYNAHKKMWIMKITHSLKFLKFYFNELSEVYFYISLCSVNKTKDRKQEKLQSLHAQSNLNSIQNVTSTLRHFCSYFQEILYICHISLNKNEDDLKFIW